MSRMHVELQALRLVAEVMQLKIHHLVRQAGGADSSLINDIHFVANDLLEHIATMKEIIEEME